MTKKDFTYLAVGAIIIAIAIKNRKEEQEENRIITIGGRRFWNEEPKWEDTKPAPEPVAPSDLINQDAKAGRNGYEFIS